MTIDSEWDNILSIRTTGRDDSIADLVRFPYEPTDYCVLERLANSGYFTKRNTLLDYGCGKGRVISSWPVKPNAGPSASNTTRGFMSGPCRIKSREWRAAG